MFTYPVTRWAMFIIVLHIGWELFVYVVLLYVCYPDVWFLWYALSFQGRVLELCDMPVQYANITNDPFMW